MNNKLEYFPMLTPMRGLAAIIVLIVHVEGIKENFLFTKSRELPIFHQFSADYSVLFFFVLSGFLITYLLLNEQKNNGYINIKSFYFRRAIRLYPLYFLIVLFCFSLILFYPNFFGETNLAIESILIGALWYLFFLANIRRAVGGSIEEYGVIKVPGSGPLWSIGVEHQFYFFWPLIIKAFKKRIINFIIILLLTLPIVYKLYYYLYFKYLESVIPVELHNVVVHVIHHSGIYALLVGALGAWCFIEKPSYVLGIGKKYIGVILMIIIIPAWAFGFKLGDYTYELISFLFIILILHLIIRFPKKIVNKFAYRLGKISYGIYILHWIVILFWLKFLEYKKLYFGNFIDEILIYGGGITLTILFANISFRFFESKFLYLSK